MKAHVDQPLGNILGAYPRAFLELLDVNNELVGGSASVRRDRLSCTAGLSGARHVVCREDCSSWVGTVGGDGYQAQVALFALRALIATNGH